MKVLDLEKNIYELSKENKEVIDIMKDLGFDQIANPAIREIVGRKMTIPFGCKMRKVDIFDVIERFEKEGFEVINKPKKEEHHERTDKQ